MYSITLTSSLQLFSSPAISMILAVAYLRDDGTQRLARFGWERGPSLLRCWKSEGTFSVFAATPTGGGLRGKSSGSSSGVCVCVRERGASIPYKIRSCCMDPARGV